MKRVKVIIKEVKVPVIVMGVPIDGYYNTYLAVPTPYSCKLRARLMVKAWKGERGSEPPAKALLHGANLTVSERIMLYADAVLSRLGLGRVDGEVAVSCDRLLPEASIFAVATLEVLKSLLESRSEELKLLTDVLARVDEEFIRCDPGYMKAIRCSRMHGAPCIVRGFEEVLCSEGAPLCAEVEWVHLAPCKDPCLSLRPRLDSYALSLTLKLTSHVIASVARALREGALAPAELDLAMLLYALESSLVNLDGRTSGLIGPVHGALKPLSGFRAIEFYKIKMVDEPCRSA